MANPAFLRTAREALGLTQGELAVATGLDQADVSRWERGLRTPAADHLERLAAGLQVSASLLTSDVRLTVPVHRTAKAQTKRSERKVNGRLELVRLAAAEILGDLNIDTPFRFPDSDDATPADPEEAAEAIRRVWRVPAGPIDDLTEVLESAGAIVVRADFGVDAILAAYTHVRGDRRWCFINTRTIDGARARFSLAHELGHAILHWDRFDAPSDKDAEKEAHRFAAALLMPRREIGDVFARSRLTIQDFITIRQRWKVSISALITRARDLGAISDSQRSRMYRQLNARGWLRSEPGYISLEEPSVLRDALDIHRHDYRHSDTDLAEIARLPRDRLADLLPDYFDPEHRRAQLRSVGPAT